ncbi:polysaccharide biosynthesis protein [Hyphomonas sp.]|uniref:polysaccharide biosynthesis protein n=1 Tax=Hyphomonas sp. TaxID=87 RepID=UPI0025C576A4|nr:polysaccharide biosynthesis protein [Hyphomonas sp.]MBI1400873.1 NAD-dependent epimerase/dehydratase family protein [Hyphomonas sp.]
MTPRDAARRAMALTLSFDLAMAGLGMTLAHLAMLVSDRDVSHFPVQAWLLATAAFMLAAACGLVTGSVHRQVWRHIGAPDAFKLIQGIALSVLLYLPVMVALNGRLHNPLPTLLVTITLWTAALFAGRMFARYRTTNAPLQIFQRLPHQSQPVLLVGDADSWVNVLRRLEASAAGSTVRVLGLIEVSSDQPGRAVRGVPIMGNLDTLGEVIDVLSLRYGSAPWVAVTGPARERGQMARILEIASTHRADIMALGHDETAQTLEPIRAADLLARPERALDRRPVRDLISGARIVVTGGGGSIGSELALQVAQNVPAALTIIDSSEFNLYQIDHLLRVHHPSLPFTSHLGDIRDPVRMNAAFAQSRPEIVIHAAALKHVPLMEENICEAILTNVGGAVNVARAAAASGARQFVFISTDKAVAPDNVMGATKRLAELAISRITTEAGMASAMVRFGNVLGSSGSVVPLFERQIAAGGPVTITDPEATRYFMTIEEATSLVLQAAALQREAHHAELFVLDMGEPIAIRQLAETMIRLKGKVPGVDIEIVTTGMRKGEKRHEALTYAYEELETTRVDGVNRVVCEPPQNELLEKQISVLMDAARRHETLEALRLLGNLVPEYGAALAATRRRKPA